MSKFVNKIAAFGAAETENKSKKSKAVFLDVQPVTPQNLKNRDVQSEKKEQKNVIYKSMVPIIMVSKIIGMLPVQRDSANKFSFNIASGSMLYCAGMFGLILAYIVYIQFDKVQFFKSGEARFEEVVIEYLFYTYLIPVLLIPLMWYETNKVTDCLNLWLEFEKFYKHVNNRDVSMNMVRKSLFVAIVLPVIGAGSMVIIHITMVNFKIVQVIPYCIVNTVVYLIAGYWYTMSAITGKVAVSLSDDFLQILKHTGPSWKIAEFRTLWLKLTQIARDIGFSTCYSMIFLCLYLFLTITLSIYGLLSQLQSGLGLKDVGLTLTASLSIAILYFVCDQAHIASSSVKDDFQKKLLTIELSWLNEDAQQEISMFLRATEMNSTELSLGGFFDVNRTLFKSLIATMVTYLVVLLQFQISLPEDGGSTNSTMAT